jgi:hypothetical protein
MVNKKKQEQASHLFLFFDSTESWGLYSASTLTSTARTTRRNM